MAKSLEDVCQDYLEKGQQKWDSFFMKWENMAEEEENISENELSIEEELQPSPPKGRKVSASVRQKLKQKKLKIVTGIGLKMKKKKSYNEQSTNSSKKRCLTKRKQRIKNRSQELVDDQVSNAEDKTLEEQLKLILGNFRAASTGKFGMFNVLARTVSISQTTHCNLQFQSITLEEKNQPVPSFNIFNDSVRCLSPRIMPVNNVSNNSPQFDFNRSPVATYQRSLCNFYGQPRETNNTAPFGRLSFSNPRPFQDNYSLRWGREGFRGSLSTLPEITELASHRSRFETPNRQVIPRSCFSENMYYRKNLTQFASPDLERCRAVQSFEPKVRALDHISPRHVLPSGNVSNEIALRQQRSPLTVSTSFARNKWESRNRALPEIRQASCFTTTRRSLLRENELHLTSTARDSAEATTPIAETKSSRPQKSSKNKRRRKRRLEDTLLLSSSSESDDEGDDNSSEKDCNDDSVLKILSTPVRSRRQFI